MAVSWQEGLLALANGAASFMAAAVLASIFWLFYLLNNRIGFSRGFGRVLSSIDITLRTRIVHLTGATLKASWRRWPTFILFFSGLAAGAAFAPAPIALGSVGFALIAVLSVYRLWEHDEDQRIERRSKGKSDYDGQDMRDEMFAAISVMLFFIPLGYVRISELTPVTSGHSPYPALDAAFFVWGELTKALPLVDWSEVYRVRNLSGVESVGTIGMSLNFFIRVLFDLLVLAGIIRTLGILRNQALGIDLRGPEAAMKTGDPARINPALDTIRSAAMKGHRNAIAHLFEITQASRGDGRLVEPKWREKSARALTEVADILLSQSLSLTDLDNLLLAIEAQKVSARFMKSIDRKFAARIQNNLGIALHNLGTLSGDSLHFEEAVKAYLAALETRTRDSAPADWAATQNNLGIALASLGWTTNDARSLDEAVAAFRAALQVRTRDAAPTDWAQTQGNLASVLSGIGEEAGNTAQIEEAIEILRAALEVHTREAAPNFWASIQSALGAAYGRLGRLTGAAEELAKAAVAFREALKVHTRDTAPFDWAGIQSALGNALADLGDLLSDSAYLREAELAYRAALEVQTRGAMPTRWALTQNNLGNTLSTLGRLTADAAEMGAAVKAYRAALEVHTHEAMPIMWAMTQNNLGFALATLGEWTDDTAHLENAAKAYRAALEVYTRDAMPTRWTASWINLGLALEALWRLDRGELHREAAKEIWAELIAFYEDQQNISEANVYRRRIEEIDAAFSNNE